MDAASLDAVGAAEGAGAPALAAGVAEAGATAACELGLGLHAANEIAPMPHNRTLLANPTRLEGGEPHATKLTTNPPEPSSVIRPT